MVIWLIGLSGSGKTTLGHEIVERARSSGSPVVWMDGDKVRSEIFGDDLGHTLADRKRNADRICRLCKFLDDEGVNVVCGILSMFHESREWNRTHITRYYEVYIDAPLDQLAARDSKGLYSGAREGRIRDVPGIDMEFPVPQHPDLVIRNDSTLDALLAHAPRLADLLRR